MSATAEAKRAANEAASSPWMEGLARAGLVAKGLTYCIVAALAINVAVSGGGQLEDRPGALHEVAQSSFGRILLAGLAVGLAGYAIWLAYGVAIGDVPLILVDLAGVAGAALVLRVTLSLRRRRSCPAF